VLVIRNRPFACGLIRAVHGDAFMAGIGFRLETGALCSSTDVSLIRRYSKSRIRGVRSPA